MSDKFNKAKNRKVITKEQLIVDVWKRTARDSVGASELALIQQALIECFGAGAPESPASIARTLADHGARLRHREILEFDVRWREHQVFGLFTPEELNFGTLSAASEWVEKLDALHRHFELEQDATGLKHLRQLVLQIKRELELVAKSEKAGDKNRRLAEEVVRWLTIWLHTPQIFGDWLSLRRRSSGFSELFGS